MTSACTQVSLPLEDGVVLLDIAFTGSDPKHGFLTGTKQTLLETFDGGKNWEPRYIDSVDEEGINYRYNAVSFSGSEGWIVGKPGKPHISTVCIDSFLTGRRHICTGWCVLARMDVGFARVEPLSSAAVHGRQATLPRSTLPRQAWCLLSIMCDVPPQASSSTRRTAVSPGPASRSQTSCPERPSRSRPCPARARQRCAPSQVPSTSPTTLLTHGRQRCKRRSMRH